MLSRTADHLFWMARYMERAENTARMLDVNYQTALLPQSADMAEQGWRGLLSISELTWSFSQKYSEVTARNVMDFMVRDETNPSQHPGLPARGARERTRGARRADHRGLGDAEPDLARVQPHAQATAPSSATPATFFEWVKFRSHLSRGVTVGTMLQDEALHFLRIGTFLERADNTARLLDVKFHALAGEYFGAGNVKESQEVDFYHWSAILRSVSGFEIYRKVYRNVIRPEKVAELLILRPDMPRSLAACMNEVRGQPANWWPTSRAARRCAAPAACAPTCSTAASTRSWPPACTPT